jgi:hypothetical protein
MLCCQETACKTCVLKKMSTYTGEGTIKEATKITGEFRCSLCQATKYSPDEVDYKFPLKVNKSLFGMLDDISEVLPVTSEKYPNSFVTWYNKSTKKIHCDEEHAEFPQNFGEYIRINRKEIFKFFGKIKESLISFNTKISEAIINLTELMNEETTQTAPEFLEMTSKVKKLYSFYSDYT